jgi:uncharacterized membrane protein
MARRSFLRDQRGAVAIVTAAAGVTVVGMTALAVDVGAIFLQSRQLQGIADLAAISGANELDNASSAVSTTTNLNAWRSGAIKAKTTVGTYRPAAGVAPTDRFSTGGPTPNAVRVKLEAPATVYFARIFTHKSYITISRTATAARPELASFEIGSRLAALRGGVANAALSALTGSSVSLTVMDYNALVTADVDLLGYMKALQTHAHLEGASFDKALAAEINNREALNVLADTLASGGNVSAAAALRKVATAANQDPAQLQKLFDLGPYGAFDRLNETGGSEVRVNALDIANALLMLSKEGRQVKLDVTAAAPGLASADAWLAIGERPNQSPWLAIDDDGGVTVRTAQARLYLETKIAPGLLGASGVANVRLPLLVELASAEARLSDIDCKSARAARSATLDVRPSLGRAAIADIDVTKLNDFKTTLTESPAVLAQILLIKIKGQAGVDIGGHQWQSVKFTQAEIDARTVRTVQTNDIAEATVTSLLGDLNVTISPLGGLGLGKNAILAALSGVLSGATPAIDNVLIGITDILGLHLGEADVRVNGLRCKPAVLVS